MPTLEDLIDEVEEWLKDAEKETGEAQGPLSDPQKSQVASDLARAETKIDQIIDPLQSPSLDPPDAGSVDTSEDPSTLPEFADTCYALSTAAKVAVLGPTPDYEVIGTKIKTIKELVPEYRNLAGIT